MERTIILYHGNCPDGFGGAYAAWKKFGDTAEYRPMSYGNPVPEDLAGARVYFIDFCYDQERMDAVKAVASTLTVLDHHEGVEEVSTSMPEHVYDANRSGATIAWSYFHPETPVPYLLSLIEDDDLFRFTNPDTRPLLAYISVKPFSFEFWDELASDLADPARSEALLTKVRAYREYFDLLVEQSVERAKLVEFEGYEVYAGTTHPIKPMVSAFGNALAKKKGPMGLVLQIRTEGIAVSLRGDGSLDLTTIAQKYGGNGHPSSCAFFLPWGTSFPWKPVVNDDEDSSH
jgi:oligoribonuclease NrnB/cAMP/cGMP phosphodiesterase (DHH superfamily)